MSDCSTHAFDVPLKSCPFCGSGWLYETWRNGYCGQTPTMFCNSCKAVVTWEQVEEEGVNDETQAFVREHWNTRAERTCHDDNIGGSFVCSECGANVKDTYIGRSYVDKFGKRWYATSNGQAFNYCPNCGCKVVGE